MPRLFFASLLAYTLSQTFNAYLYGVYREAFPGHTMVVASTVCLVVAQALDTLLFTYVGLYGILDAIPEILFISYTIKLLVIIGFVPFTHLYRRLLEKVHV